MKTTLEHEMGYTHKLIETISANEILVHVPKVKERLNMLKEVLGDIEDHYTTSKRCRQMSDMFKKERLL